jgi:GntR family transcriptional regulator, transcriptional repressor for pyruvate dehydrogenase complex
MDDDPHPKSTNIADTIFGDLRTQILKGKLKPGERLPGERELAAAYGTNRNTLREAVRKLEQSRLVAIRHGRGVTVTDFRRSGTLELLAPYLQSGPDMREVVGLVEDVLAPRVLLLEHATRLAVQRADETDLKRLEELSELLITAFEAKQAKVVAKGFQRWLDALIDAGHSVAVRWIANPFLDALRQMLMRLPTLWILEPSFPEHLRGLVAAIAEGNEEAAVRITREYYQRVDEPLLKLLRTTIARSQLSAARAAAQPASSATQTDSQTVAPGPAHSGAGGINGATALSAQKAEVNAITVREQAKQDRSVGSLSHGNSAAKTSESET